MLNDNLKQSETSLIEFSPEKDPFSKARKKSSRRWILAHIFHDTNKIFIFIVLFTTILTANLSTIIFVFIGNAITAILNLNFPTFMNIFIIIIILNFTNPGMRLANFMLREVIAQRMERDTRKEFFINLLGKSQSFHDQQKIGELMARATDDVRTLNFFISPAISLILESFTDLVVPVIYIAIFYPVQLIIEPIIFVILFLISLRSYINKIGPISFDLRMNFGLMDATLNETLTGIEVVKGTAQEDREIRKYLYNIQKYKDAFIKQGIVQAKYLPILLLALIITIAFGHSIFLFYSGLMNIGQIIAYLGILNLLYFPTNISIFVFAIIRLAGASAKRILEYMNMETKIDENIKGVIKKIQGEIIFEDVSFKYPNSKNHVLKDLNFEIKPGKTVAIVGTTGAGKTTLTKLISRLYDVSSGRILIDGVDVRDYALQSLRSQISYIEQDVFLFSSSIFENITFGRTGSLEEVIEVSKQAQAHEFISELPEGFYSEIGERGVQLSGGERQRIAIARAFLSDPPILILDDSTSAIDSKTEDQIQFAIRNILRNRTTFLITHRLSQIRWADLILVLRNGELIAMGTHDDLLCNSEEYRKIFIKKFDLEEQKLIKGGWEECLSD
jgi:ATP-binding cassette subfamily B protein